jgi:cytochrome c peroxidase
MKKILLVVAALALVFGAGSYAVAGPGEAILGGFIYFDENLSNPGGQSCASCHLPRAGFVDPDQSLPVSAGVVSGKFGGRNAPSAAYAAYSPDFYFDTVDGLWIGGQFWDGRAKDLEAQAQGPFLNPAEMNNTKEGVIKAIRKSAYASLFRQVYGRKSLDNVETAYVLVSQAIAAFERTKPFNSFSSKYDYYLQGKVKLTAKEERGRLLFEGQGNCAACHPSTTTDGTLPLFTDFSYDNLGIPKNPEIGKLIGEEMPVDLGLGAIVGDPAENGKFKVMTLRNIAKTAPYGHNGYFKTLKEIVHFYNTRDVEVWPVPEYADTVNHDELGNLGLTSAEEDDVVAFLKTLTDDYFLR